MEKFKHKPKHEYDCFNCKFSWCCGLHCSCGLKEFPHISDEFYQQLVRKAKLVKIDQKLLNHEIISGR